MSAGLAISPQAPIYAFCIYFQQINAARRQICANKSFDADCSLQFFVSVSVSVTDICL